MNLRINLQPQRTTYILTCNERTSECIRHTWGLFTIRGSLEALRRMKNNLFALTLLTEREKGNVCRNRQTATASSFSTTLLVWKKTLPECKCSAYLMCVFVCVFGSRCICLHCMCDFVCTCVWVGAAVLRWMETVCRFTRVRKHWRKGVVR